MNFSNNLDLIMEMVHKTPNSTFWLIMFMSIAAALIINFLVDVSLTTIFVAVPVLVSTGLLWNAILTLNGVILSEDRAQNAALATSMGFIVLMTLILALVRISSMIRDRL